MHDSVRHVGMAFTQEVQYVTHEVCYSCGMLVIRHQYSGLSSTMCVTSMNMNNYVATLRQYSKVRQQCQTQTDAHKQIKMARSP